MVLTHDTIELLHHITVLIRDGDNEIQINDFVITLDNVIARFEDAILPTISERKVIDRVTKNMSYLKLYHHMLSGWGAI